MADDLETSVHDWWLDLDSLRQHAHNVEIEGWVDCGRFRRRGHMTIHSADIGQVVDRDLTSQLLVGEVHVTTTQLSLLSFGPQSELHLHVRADWSYTVHVDITAVTR